MKDSLGRVWQCGTIQIDFNMPKQLGAEYVTEDNNRETPVMLHRAIVGSLERFIGILIENFGGAFPLWLSPTQVGIATITKSQDQYAKKILDHIKEAGFRVKEDLRNEKISYKIREFSLLKVPYLLIIGKEEVESNSVSVRARGNMDLGKMSIGEFLGKLHKDLETKV